MLGIGSRWAVVSSGDQIDLRDDPLGPHRTIDLDRRSGAGRLCPGARRQRPTEGETGTHYVPMTYVGGRALSESTPDHFTLTDCRTRARRAVPSGTMLTACDLVVPVGVPATAYRLRDLRNPTTSVVNTTLYAFAAVSRSRLWTEDETGLVRSTPLP